MKYTTEVFSSDGDLAIMRDGFDIAHVSFPTYSEDPPAYERAQLEKQGDSWQASDDEKQAIIDAVVTAFDHEKEKAA